MRWMLVSRSSFEKPRPFERWVRTVSPSRYSTTSPRRSSSGRRGAAIVVLPEPESPVNQRVKPPAGTTVRLGVLVPRRLLGHGVSLQRSVDAAFELVGAGPAAGPLLLVGVVGRVQGCSRSTDSPSSCSGLYGNLVDGDVRPDALLVPVGERVHLPDAVALRPLDLRRRRAARRLVAADAGDPGTVGLERLDQRLDLADVAAAVGIALPEVRAFAAVLLGDRDHLGADQLEAVALDQPVAGLVASRGRRAPCRARRRRSSSPSSETMCTSTDDCFCQEQVRQSWSPNSS